jgi:selenocysteine-specific elongation factor
VARGADPFVLRSFSPVTTIGGGWIVDPLPPARKAIWPDGLDHENLGERLRALIERRPDGVAAKQVAVLLGVNHAEVSRLLTGSDRFLLAEDHWVGREAVEGLERTALAAVEEHHRARPHERGIPLAELKQSLGTAQWLATATLARLELEGKLTYRDGLASVPGHQPRVSGGSGTIDQLVARISAADLAPPSTAELTASLGSSDIPAALRVAVGQGLLVPVERDRHYSPEAIERFVDTLVEVGRAGSITPAQIRDRLGISRKFLIPLLEWADARGITVREGEGRTLRPGTQLPWRIPVT